MIKKLKLSRTLDWGNKARGCRGRRAPRRPGGADCTVYLRPFVPPSSTNTSVSKVCVCVSRCVKHNSLTEQHTKTHHKAPFRIIALLYLSLLLCPLSAPSSLFSSFVILNHPPPAALLPLFSSLALIFCSGCCTLSFLLPVFSFTFHEFLSILSICGTIF